MVLLTGHEERGTESPLLKGVWTCAFPFKVVGNIIRSNIWCTGFHLYTNRSFIQYSWSVDLMRFGNLFLEKLCCFLSEICRGLGFFFKSLFGNNITISPFVPSCYCWTCTCPPDAFLWIQSKLGKWSKALESQKEGVFFLASRLWSKPLVGNLVRCLLKGASYPEHITLLHCCLSSGCLLIFRKSLSCWLLAYKALRGLGAVWDSL